MGVETLRDKLEHKLHPIAFRQRLKNEKISAPLIFRQSFYRSPGNRSSGHARTQIPAIDLSVSDQPQSFTRGYAELVLNLKSLDRGWKGKHVIGNSAINMQFLIPIFIGSYIEKIGRKGTGHRRRGNHDLNELRRIGSPGLYNTIRYSKEHAYARQGSSNRSRGIVIVGFLGFLAQ